MMSKKFIFNRKLNRRKPLWYAAIMLVIGLFTFGVVAQENTDVDFVDPQALANNQKLSHLSNIDFIRTGDSANVVIQFENGAPAVSYVEAQGKVNITFENTHINDDQFVQIDVTQFGTAVKSLETFQNEGSSRLEIKYDGGVKIKKMESENEVQFSISPLTKDEISEAQGVTYTGKPISLDFQDVPVRQVLQIIAQVNGFNLVTTDTVSGNVTISLSGVPWDQALDMILKIRGLDKRLEGNILLIAPSEELTARETQALQSKQQVQKLAELKSANISVNYARAD
jgi:type IV pilus assembly protein PilQ